MPKVKSPWLNTHEAAEYLRISHNALRRHLERGNIKPDGRLGRCLRFRVESLDRYMEGGKEAK